MHILVFQHIDVEHPGILRDLMAADGNTWDVVELDRGGRIPDALDGYDALLVMGGPMDVSDETRLPWLAREKRAIRHWAVERGAPFLGICLGHQLLAEALGGKVGAMETPEVGIYSVRLTPEGKRDGLFRGLESPLPCLQWHGAEVKTLPPAAVVCADDDAGSIQAFRCGPWAYGLQFHVEVTAATAGEWAEVPEYRRSLEAVMGRDGVERLVRETKAALPSINTVARRIYSNFVDMVGSFTGLSTLESSAHIRTTVGPMPQ